MEDKKQSPEEYLDSLQREYICLEIREKIYVNLPDKTYFKHHMVIKESKIKSVSRVIKATNIIDDGAEYLRIWDQIVPKWGFPSFIYNRIELTEKEKNFCFAGSVVKAGDLYGMTKKFIFDTNSVELILPSGALAIFKSNRVQRVDNVTQDEYFYYLPGNQFKCKGHGIGTLTRYEIKNRVAYIELSQDNIVTLHRNDITRLL